MRNYAMLIPVLLGLLGAANGQEKDDPLQGNWVVVQTERGLTRINGLFRHGWLLAPALVEEALLAAGLTAVQREAA